MDMNAWSRPAAPTPYVKPNSTSLDQKLHGRNRRQSDPDSHPGRFRTSAAHATAPERSTLAPSQAVSPVCRKFPALTPRHAVSATGGLCKSGDICASGCLVCRESSIRSSLPPRQSGGNARGM